MKKYHVDRGDLQTVVENILENPPPQMIFNWGEHSAERRLVLSLLAEFSEQPGAFLSAHEIRRGITKNKLELVIGHAQLNSVLAELFQDEYVLQKDHKYGFRLDLFRRWIRHDHNIWQVKKEIGTEELARITKPAEQQEVKRKRARIVVERGMMVLAACVAVYYGFLYFFSSQRKVMITANGGPFSVEIDGVLAGTTRGQEDSTKFVAHELRKGKEYEIEITHLISRESKREKVEITEDNQEIRFDFREHPLTIVSDAARMKGKLGGLELPIKNQPESWHYTFYATAGTYPLVVWASQNGSSSIDTMLTIPAQNDTIRLDFPDLVIITLKANLSFTYQFVRNRLKIEKRKIAEAWSVDSTVVTLRGCSKGSYYFTFTNSRTGQAIAREKSITRDDTIEVNFGDNVIITLRANAPFIYKTVHEKSKKVFESQASAFKHFIEGCPQGWYQFAFTDPQTGQTITRKQFIQKNETININFPVPPTTRLRINTEPSDAEVILNGKPTGRITPYLEYHSKGPYTIELVKPGYDTLDVMIFLNTDTTITKKLVAQNGYLIVAVNARDGGAALRDAKIYVKKAGESQEQYLGEAGKLANQPAELQVGSYIMRIVRDGFNDHRGEITVRKGKTEKLQVELTKQ
ncbi:MAG: PEGA domain-containing protein [candidate division KSB1 bacterium]|nr:PEGA domain-containing protein [candidate division KSB1 bacterium]MDZ7365353.1 PEGA domain-containing protein [candidate division KSB1 bacterium]MDZ7407380.1 PEGA domain-containing protein [candidate division KSB1 bacterium]